LNANQSLKAQYQERLDVGDGLANVSLGSRGLAADRARLASAGLPIDPILNARRAIIRPDGVADETDSSCFYVWRKDNRFMSLFHSHHAKPETIFIGEYEHHANSVRDILRLVYMSRNPSADTGYFSTLLCTPPTVVAHDAYTWAGARGEIVEILSVERAAQRYGSRLPPDPLGPLIGVGVALHYAVSSLETCERHLAAHGVPYTRDDSGLVIAANAACGVVTVFEETTQRT